MKLSTFFIAVLLVVLTAVNSTELHACTSWMVFSDLTRSNTNILHKNRDSRARNIRVLLSPADAPRKWIAIGGTHTNSGINTSGLAGAMNSGEKCLNPPNVKGKKGTPAMLQEILSSCDTAAMAVKKLKEFIKAGDYSHGENGSIFFFLDTREGYICEMTAKDVSVQRCDHGYALRANVWHNPDMYQYSKTGFYSYMNTSARAYSAMSGLNKIIAEKGKITPLEIFTLSRHYAMPKESPYKNSVCRKETNSTSTIEVDKQYPDVLSSMYVTIGHPRHTVYIPVPVCTEKVLITMDNFKWAENAFKRFDKLKLEAPMPKEWIDFELKSNAQYAKAKEDARKLLKAGKRAEAVKLLNTTAEKIWIEAEKLLNIQ